MSEQPHEAEHLEVEPYDDTERAEAPDWFDEED